MSRSGDRYSGGTVDDARHAEPVLDQFETIFFSQVNFIKAALPQFRAQHTGHIMILTSIGGHIGTPGMPMYTAATWALEGFCDSLAYEIAPFNIKVTIVQPNKEVQDLTNKIILAPQLAFYDGESNPAPSIREMLTNVLNVSPETAVDPAESEIVYRYPKLPSSAVDRLVMETVHALTAIGGHENPPARPHRRLRGQHWPSRRSLGQSRRSWRTSSRQPWLSTFSTVSSRPRRARAE